MKTIFAEIITAMAFLGNAFAMSPNLDELAVKSNWVSKCFDNIDNDDNLPGIYVLENQDTIQKNGRYGRKLQIAGIRYDNGIFCNAPAKFLIKLPKQGKSFEAVVGIDDALQWDVKDYPSGPIWPEVIISASLYYLKM